MWSVSKRKTWQTAGTQRVVARVLFVIMIAIDVQQLFQTSYVDFVPKKKKCVILYTNW